MGWERLSHRRVGAGALPGWARTRGLRGCRGEADLSAVALLGVLQSEFMDAMEMMDICL